MKDGLREIQVLASLKHRNVTEFKQIVIGSSDIFLAIELCQVQLADLLRSGLSDGLIKAIMQQLFTGLKYIHGLGLIHRDIKLDNLMLKDGVLKIGDFGSTVCHNKDAWTPQVVTLWYRPPEILLGYSRQTFAVDIWSAGCVFGELIAGYPLFRGDSELNQINLIVDLLGTPTEKDWPGLDSLPVMQCMSLNVRQRKFEAAFENCTTNATLKLISAMLTYDPDKRPTAEQCLAANFFTEPPAMMDEDGLRKFCKHFEEVGNPGGRFRSPVRLPNCSSDEDAEDTTSSEEPKMRRNRDKVGRIRKRLHLDV